MARSELAAHLSVVALLCAAAAALAFWVDVDLSDAAGVRMALPGQAGVWRAHEVRYCHAAGCGKRFDLDDLEDPAACPSCGEPLHVMSLAEKEVLPADTRFVKARYEDKVGNRIYVSLVLSGRERSSIHRPQRCLVAQGREIVSSRAVDFPVDGREPLRAMVLDSLRHTRSPEGDVTGPPEFFVYWFVGQGRETPHHLVRMFWLGWDRVVHGVGHRWAYVSLWGYKHLLGEPIDEKLGEFIQRFYPMVLLDGE